MLTPDSTLGSARPPLGERELVFRISRKTIVFGFVLGLVLGAPGIVLLFVVTRRLIDDWSKDVSGSVLFFAVSLFFLWAGKAVWKKTNRLRHIEVAVHADGLSFYDGRTRISCLWDQVEEVRWKQSKHYDEGSLSYISHQVTVRRKHGPPLVFDEALQNIASLARALEKKCGRAKFFDESSGSRVDLDIASAPLLALQEGCFKNENLHASSPSVAPVGIGQLIGEFSDYRVGPFRVLGWASSLVGITLVVLGFLILGAEACAFGMILAGLGAVFLALAFLRNKKRFLVYTEGLAQQHGSEMTLYLWREIEEIVLDQSLRFDYIYVGILPYSVSTRNNCRLRRSDGAWIQLDIPLLSSLACSTLEETWGSWRLRRLEVQSVEPPAGDALSTAISQIRRTP